MSNPPYLIRLAGPNGRIHDLEKLLIGIVTGIAIGIEALSPEVFSCR